MGWQRTSNMGRSRKKKGCEKFLRLENINYKYPNLHLLGEVNNRRFFCKYLDVKGFFLCLDTGSIKFAEPSVWDDAYESKLYCADYSFAGLRDDMICRTYAYCVTENLSSEASWKAYIQRKALLGDSMNNETQKDEKELFCVMMKLKANTFRKSLSRITDNYTLYEGRVKYIDVNVINKLGDKTSEIYKIIWGRNPNFISFLSTILLKRLTFSYEKETRFFLVDKNNKRNYSHETAESKILDRIDWLNIIDLIVVCPDCPEQLYNEIKRRCKEKNIKCKRSMLYVQAGRRYQIGNDNTTKE